MTPFASGTFINARENPMGRTRPPARTATEPVDISISMSISMSISADPIPPLMNPSLVGPHLDCRTSQAGLISSNVECILRLAPDHQTAATSVRTHRDENRARVASRLRRRSALRQADREHPMLQSNILGWLCIAGFRLPIAFPILPPPRKNPGHSEQARFRAV